MAEKKVIAEVVAVISAAYPHFEPTEHTVEVYWQSLKHYPSDLLRMATLQSVSEPGRKFAPTIGEIVGEILKINQVVNSLPSSYQAWQEVLQQFIETGSYGDPEWSHPLVESTVKTLGWRNLCMSENQVADRARFIQAYEQLEQRAINDALMLPEVRGYIESNGGRIADGIKQLVEGMKK